jgi:hypothetical protein
MGDTILVTYYKNNPSIATVSNVHQWLLLGLLSLVSGLGLLVFLAKVHFRASKKLIKTYRKEAKNRKR